MEGQADAGQQAGPADPEQDADAGQTQHQREDPGDGLAAVVAGGAEVEQEGADGDEDAAGERRRPRGPSYAGRSRPAHGRAGSILPGDLAQRDPAAAGAGRGVAEDDLVAVLEERAAVAEGLLAAPRQLQERAAGVRGRAR